MKQTVHHDLIRTNNASDNSVCNVRGTRESTTLSKCVIEECSVLIGGGTSALGATVDAQELASPAVQPAAPGEVSPVLDGPARWTGLGARDHHRDGLGSSAQGARHVILVFVCHELVLRAKDRAVVSSLVGGGVKLWLQGQTETVGASSCVIVPRPSGYSCGQKQGNVYGNADDLSVYYTEG